jgi:hypothetical protein
MQRITIGIIGALLTIALCSCAHLDFGEDGGLTYYEPTPYVVIALNKDCTVNASLIILPGKAKVVALKPGYGNNKLSVNLSNGMITSVNQETDTQLPATIAALTGLATAAVTATKGDCTPSATLYRVKNGVPDKEDFIWLKAIPK